MYVLDFQVHAVGACVPPDDTLPFLYLGPATQQLEERQVRGAAVDCGAEWVVYIGGRVLANGGTVGWDSSTCAAAM